MFGTISEKITVNSIPENKNINGKVLVGGIIFNDSFTHMLLIRGKISGKWGVPKGHREHYETNLDGAVREIFEETGLKIDYTLDLLPSINCKKAKLFMLAVPMSTELGTIDFNEIIDMRWVCFNDLDSLTPKTRMLETIVQKVDSLANKAKQNTCNYKMIDDRLVVGQHLLHTIQMMMNSSTTEEIVEEISTTYRFLSRVDIEQTLNNLMISPDFYRNRQFVM